MCGPQVRFCERPGGAIPRAYSTLPAARTVASDRARCSRVWAVNVSREGAEARRRKGGAKRGIEMTENEISRDEQAPRSVDQLQ